MRLLLAGLVLLAGSDPGQIPAAPAPPARYAVIIQGASGEPQYASLHRGWVTALAAVLKDRLRVEPAKVTVLTEQPNDQELRGTAENVRAVLSRLAKETRSQDLVLITLIGHGSGDAAAAKFNLVGPDLSTDEWSALLKPIPARIAFVDTTSSSFPFVAALSGENRVVITATNSYAQRYHTMFPDAFIQALMAPEADADKNGRMSLLEAFTHASRLVALHYEQSGRMATENAVLEDTGDGKGRIAAAQGPDGTIAGLTYLDAVASPTTSDPAVRDLQIRQQALTDQIDELRRRRPSISAEAFDREFEKLIIDLALVSREVRRRLK